MSLVQEHQGEHVYPSIGDANFDHLVEVVFARFLHCEATVFPLFINL